MWVREGVGLTVMVGLHFKISLDGWNVTVQIRKQNLQESNLLLDYFISRLALQSITKAQEHSPEYFISILHLSEYASINIYYICHYFHGKEPLLSENCWDNLQPHEVIQMHDQNPAGGNRAKMSHQHAGTIHLGLQL